MSWSICRDGTQNRNRKESKIKRLFRLVSDILSGKPLFDHFQQMRKQEKKFFFKKIITHKKELHSMQSVAISTGLGLFIFGGGFLKFLQNSYAHSLIWTLTWVLFHYSEILWLEDAIYGAFLAAFLLVPGVVLGQFGCGDRPAFGRVPLVPRAARGQLTRGAIPWGVFRWPLGTAPAIL